MENKINYEEMNHKGMHLDFKIQTNLFQLKNETVSSKLCKKAKTEWVDLYNMDNFENYEVVATNMKDQKVLIESEDLLATNKKHFKRESLKFKIKLNNFMKNHIPYYKMTSIDESMDAINVKPANFENIETSCIESNDVLRKGQRVKCSSFISLKNRFCIETAIKKDENMYSGETLEFETLKDSKPIGSPDLFDDDVNTDELVNKEQREESKKENQSKFKTVIDENEALERIKNFLNNEAPLSSECFFQSQLENLVVLNKNNIINFVNKDNHYEKNFACPGLSEDIIKIGWPQILSVNYYGVNYNLSNKTEEIEILYLSIIERFVKCETRSSFKLSPNNKIKGYLTVVPQSPRSRLSHLAKRRAMFSSENLLVASQKTTNAIKKKSIVMSSKNKVPTPRKKILANKNRKNCHTPLSIEKTRQLKNYDDCTFLKETTKRSLFSSPLQNVVHFQMSKTTIKPEEKLRIEKSKRALFSPENLNKSENLLGKKQLPDHKEPDLKKRKIADNKVYLEEVSDNDLIKSMKCKSQNFCADISQFSSSIAQGSSLMQYSSETNFSNQLSDSHKKKLLWAVSKALQNQKIGISHPEFKRLVSTLARAVKRLFLQFHKKRNSTSETLLKLSKKYVYSAMNGKTVDEIYLMEKIDLENRAKGLKINSLRHVISLETGESQNIKKYLSSSVVNDSTHDADFLFLRSNLTKNDENKSYAFANCSITSSTNPLSCVSKKNADSLKKEKTFSTERRSGRKLFTGKDESNVSPCLENSTKFCNKSKFCEVVNTVKDRNFTNAKRRISFDE